jgi:hypothetical protein
MTYLDSTVGAGTPSLGDFADTPAEARVPLVLVLEDGWTLSEAIRGVCAFLEIHVERLDSDEPLLPFLQRCRPMAIIAPMEAEGQDGAHVLMTVAQYDRSLPVLLLSDGDPALAGAADAVIDLWGLSCVSQSTDWPAPGQFAEFLCHAGVQGNCLGMMPV